MSDKTTLIEDMKRGDIVSFRCRFDYADHWCDVTAWEVAGWTVDDGPLFQRKGGDFRPDIVETTDEAERYLNGFIKWDGCSEFRFAPDEDMAVSYGHFHWCGPSDYRKHFALLEYLYKRAQSLMKSGNDDPWDDVAASRENDGV